MGGMVWGTTDVMTAAGHTTGERERKVPRWGPEHDAALAAAPNVIDRAVHNSPPPLDDVGGVSFYDFDEKDPSRPGVNPKDLLQQRQNKVPLGLIPPVAKEAQARVHQYGAFGKMPEAYGPYNWRNYTVLLSVYCDAAERHIDAIRRGEWADPESKESHAAHAAACMNVIMDAKHVGKLKDDLQCKDPEPEEAKEVRYGPSS